MHFFLSDLKTIFAILFIMKTMTCKQLGGACDLQFHAETFEEMAGQSKKHAMEMFQTNDIPHLEAMTEMAERMKDPQAMQEWMAGIKREFDSLPADK